MSDQENGNLPEFRDLPPDHWAFRAITACRRADILHGYEDEYRPVERVNRAQIAVYLSRGLAGGDAQVPDPPSGIWTFTDVPPRHWAFKYVEYAKARGLITGVGTDYFPAQLIDRAQLAVFLARTDAGGEEKVPSIIPEEAPVATFTDVPPEHYAFRYIQYVSRQGFIDGYPDGTFRPEEKVTRDHLAGHLARMFKL